jgi:putative Mg2+ transporter-C (MgtC) family protein
MLEVLARELSNPFAPLPFSVVVLRILAAMAFGGAIGWERHIHNKPAGMRTHMMIALAACVFTLVAFGMIEQSWAGNESVKFDPLRLTAAVTSGVAFLAAGTIINARGHIHGLTTGAGMWLAGALGLAAGAGQIPLAALATGLALVVLWLLRRFEKSPDEPEPPPEA